jgi:hypothetical protein
MAKKTDKSSPEHFNFFSFERGVTVTPKFSETFRSMKDWVLCGLDNLYPQEMLRLYNDASSLHSAIIKKKGLMIAGKGFDMDSLQGSAKTFLENRFGNEDGDAVAERMALDLALQGGAYIAVTRSRESGKISMFQHVPYEKVRRKKNSPDYFISNDWEFFNRPENRPYELPAFNSRDEGLFLTGSPVQLIFIKSYEPGADFYALPQYRSTLNWVKVASEIAVFHLKSIQNNMNGGMIVIMKEGIPPQEQREAEYQRLKARYAGADVAGDILMIYASSKDKAPEIFPMPNSGSDERFKELMVQVNNNIVQGHCVNSIFAGIETSGKLGTRNEVADSMMAVQNTVIEPYQIMIEKVFERMLEINGIKAEPKLKKFELYPQTDETIAPQPGEENTGLLPSEKPTSKPE